MIHCPSPSASTVLFFNEVQAQDTSSFQPWVALFLFYPVASSSSQVLNGTVGCLCSWSWETLVPCHMDTMLSVDSTLSATQRWESSMIAWKGQCYDQGEAAGYLYPQCSPTLRQGYQVRVTMCKDYVIYNHMIYMTQGHVTFEPGEPTGGMARRARISSQASQQEGWLKELAFRAR